MSTGNPLCDEHEPLAGPENVVTDNSFDRKMHMAHATFPDDKSPSDDVFWLLEENARLRALAIRLSNLLGDLPEGECSNSAATSRRDGAAERAAIETIDFSTINQLPDRA